MRITGRQLRRIIQEEVGRMMNEEEGQVPGGGNIEEYLAGFSALAGVKVYDVPSGSGEDVNYSSTPVDGQLIWSVDDSGKIARAAMIGFDTPVRLPSGRTIARIGIVRSGTTAGDMQYPSGWTPKDYSRTSTGVTLPSGVSASPKQKITIPVKIKFGMQNVTGVYVNNPNKVSNVFIYSVTPA